MEHLNCMISSFLFKVFTDPLNLKIRSHRPLPKITKTSKFVFVLKQTFPVRPLKIIFWVKFCCLYVLLIAIFLFRKYPMAWKVFPLLVTSLLVLNAARIIYDINRKKTEHQVSNISPGEDVGLHSKELTPALRQGLENRKFIVNEDQIGLVVVRDWHASEGQ